MKYNTLMEAQMGEWPDSLVLTDGQMWDALATEVPDWVAKHKFEDWDNYEARHEINEWYAPIWYRQWRELKIEQTRAQWARAAFRCRSRDPQGFFYACSKREDGTYRYVGFRYGLEDREYASGFIDMSYTPKGESK
jgi:hypothetical protein